MTASNQPSKTRIAALDWVKGALVVLMVVYHSINYAGFQGAAFRLMGFLPTSFILLTGLLITNNYLSRYAAADWRLHQRLITRGVKLILLFIVLNLGMVIVRTGASGEALTAVSEMADRWHEIFFAPTERVASSTILNSIGYLLILASPLLLLHRLRPWLLPAVAVVLFGVCCVLEHTKSLNYYVAMVTFGILGMAIGMIPLPKLEDFSRRWAVVLVAYAVYRVCSYFLGERYPIQLAGTVFSLSILFGAGLILSEGEFVYRQFVLLGRYSLFGYIFQLVVLQLLRRVIHTPEQSVLTVTILTILTLLLTWLGTVIVEKLRQTARAFDVSYKLVFA
jgi:hypothetical protein